MSRRTPTLHPFLFGLYPIVALLAFNVGQIDVAQAVRPLVIVTIVTGALLGLMVLGFKNWHQAALSVSLWLILFFSYGHVFRVLDRAGSILADHRLLGIIWLLLLTLGTLAKWRLKSPQRLTVILNAVAATALVLPSANIVVFWLQAGSPEAQAQTAVVEADTVTSQASDLPDIYYIIVDGYGRADVLAEIYDYDNTAFLDYLRGRGFYLAGSSRANYLQTSLSLASSLNLDHIDRLTDQAGTEARGTGVLSDLIEHSQVRVFLQNYGYRLVAFPSGNGPTTLKSADVFIPYNVEVINDLEALLIVGSALAATGDGLNQLLFIPFSCEIQRGAIRHILDGLTEVPALPGPKFVFAHLMSPHPPFIFGPDGQAVNPRGNFCNGLDVDDYEGTPESYRVGYRDQVAYLSRQLQITIDAILEDSSTPPIILLQGDHGPGLLFSFQSETGGCLRERAGILSAYYLPDADYPGFYESMTPVNSFRAIFNATFDAGLSAVPDATYFSDKQHPFVFSDITDTIEDACR